MGSRPPLRHRRAVLIQYNNRKTDEHKQADLLRPPRRLAQRPGRVRPSTNLGQSHPVGIRRRRRRRLLLRRPEGLQSCFSRLLIHDLSRRYISSSRVPVAKPPFIESDLIHEPDIFRRPRGQNNTGTDRRDNSSARRDDALELHRAALPLPHRDGCNCIT